MKADTVLLGLALAFLVLGCRSGDGWQSVEIPMPTSAPQVVYERKPLSEFQFIGTEQVRRLHIGDTTLVDLPVQPSLAFEDSVYLARDSSGYRLYLKEEYVGAIVNLRAATVREDRADRAGVFLGVVGGREALKFTPASKH